MITNVATSKELYEIIEKRYELHEIPFYITRQSHNQKNKLIEIEVLNDDITVSNLHSYEFVIHYGLIVHSTQTMIESLIAVQSIEVANDFTIKTNSKNADYHVTIPANHHGWFNVPFEITNNSPTSNTDECLIYLKMIAEDISYLQEGNAIIHQYLQGTEWITDPEPVFLSYPNCDTAIIYLKHCSDHRLAKYDAETEALIPSNLKNSNYSRTWDRMNPDLSFNRGGRPYFVPVGYKSVGIKVDNFNEATCVAYHGTKATSVEPILRTGFKLPSQLDGVRKGHYELNKTYLGINNFADAIFVSPSFKYSSLYGFAEILAQNEEETDVQSGHIEHGLIRIVLLQVRIKPNKFTVNRNTTKYIVDDHHYSDDVMEWRIPNTEDLFAYRLLFMHCTDEDYTSATIRRIRDQ